MTTNKPEVKRYAPESGYDSVMRKINWMREVEDGCYVRLSDYERLQADHERLQAENAQLRAAIRRPPEEGGVSMASLTLVCYCGTQYVAREADIKRGWAKTCSKTCAATKREYGRPNARHITGAAVHFGKKYKRPNPPVDIRATGREDERDHYDDPSWDAHKHDF